MRNTFTVLLIAVFLVVAVSGVFMHASSATPQTTMDRNVGINIVTEQGLVDVTVNESYPLLERTSDGTVTVTPDNVQNHSWHTGLGVRVGTLSAPAFNITNNMDVPITTTSALSARPGHESPNTIEYEFYRADNTQITTVSVSQSSQMSTDTFTIQPGETVKVIIDIDTFEYDSHDSQKILNRKTGVFTTLELTHET